MTTAEKVKRAVAEYLCIDLSQVTDDMELEDHMAPTFIAIKIGLSYSGVIGGTITVARLIQKFEGKAKVYEPAWEYEESPKIKTVRDAVVYTTAKHKGIKPAEVTDDMAVEFENYTERNTFSNYMLQLLGFTTDPCPRYSYNKTTVKELIQLYESLHVAVKQEVNSEHR